MKLHSYSLAVIIFVLLFGGIGFTSAMNWWQTESTKVPATYTDGAAAGQYNPADIRGSYTFGEVSELFGVPLADLAAAFRLPANANPASYTVKSLEEQFAGLPVEMGTGAVRLFVAFYQGLPYELTEDEETYLFPEAAEVLRAQGRLTAEQAEYLEEHIVQEPADEEIREDAPSETAIPENAPAAAATPAPTEHTAADRMVTGKTTFQDLLDWGVTREAIEKILGESMPSPETVIKDHLSQQGLEFSSLKSQLQAEVDQ